MIDISPADEAIVNEILKKYVPDCGVRVFGSRHKWTAKSYSDLDLVIVGTAKLDKSVIYALQEAFEESELSFRVDVLDWHAISDEFRQIIEQGYSVIQEKEAENKVPDGWMVKKLGDVCSDISYGYTASANHVSGTIKFLRITDIQGHVVDWSSVPYCEIDETKLSRYKLEIGDLVVARTGNTTGMSYVMKNNNLTVFASYLIRFRFNPDVLYWEFADYVFRSKMWFDFINGIKNGSSRDGANARQLSNFEIMFPPLEEQKEIAAILSSLDDKIELNRQTNQTLEEIAQTLFKEWFIDFNFPDENGNPYCDSGGAMIDSELGQIPASWSVGKLGDYVTIKRGGSPRPIQEYLSDCGLRWLKISDATATVAPFIFDIKEFIKESGRSKTVLLDKGSLVLSNSATPGVPKILAVDSCIHDGWLYFQNSKFSNEFLYLLFKDIKVQLVQQGNGSVFTNLKTDIVKSHLMAIPENIVLNKFNELASTVFLQMKSNCQQINNLTRLRNMLLPELMLGSLR